MHFICVWMCICMLFLWNSKDIPQVLSRTSEYLHKNLLMISGKEYKNTSIPFSTYAIKSQRNIWIHFVGWKGKLKGFTSKTHPSHFCYIYLSSSSDQFLSCKYLCNPRLSTCFQFAIFLVSLHLLLPGIIRFVAEAWAVIFIQIDFWSQRTSTTKPSFNLDWISNLH